MNGIATLQRLLEPFVRDIGNTTHQLPSTLTNTEPYSSIVNEILTQPVLGVLGIIHILAVVCKYRPLIHQQYWFLQILICVIACRSGETTRAIILRIPPKWLYENDVIPTITTIWYLVNYFPFDLVYKIFGYPLILKLLQAIDNCSLVISLFGAIDTAMTLHPGSYIAPLVIGFASSIGGSLFFDMCSKVINGFETKTYELSTPTWSTKSGLIVIAIYIVGCDVFHIFFNVPLFSRNLAFILTFVILLIRSLLALVVGEFTPFPFNMIEGIFFLITRIKTSRDHEQNSVKLTKSNEHQISKTKTMNYIIKSKHE